MRLRYAAPAAAAALTLGLGLAGCSGTGDPEADQPAPSQTVASTTSEPTEAESAAPTGGTADAPQALEADQQLLDWRPADGPTADTVTTNGDWTLTVSEDSSTWELEGPGRSDGSAVSGWQVSEALLDDDWAVVVLQDQTEEQPSRAVVTDLDSGTRFTLDGSAEVPTVNGGTWALHDDRLLHATYQGADYCLAETALDDRSSEVRWCAPKRHGFTRAQATDGGDAMLTFDDSQPSCRTLVRVEGTDVVPFPGVAECKAWDGLFLDAEDETGAGAGEIAVWSVVPKERRSEEAHFYARVGEGYFDLGPGTTGTLVECGAAAYFVRDPQRSGDPAALMRWSPTAGLSVVYESPGGEAFLDRPRCGGEVLTVGAFAEQGDEQVSADVDPDRD